MAEVKTDSLVYNGQKVAMLTFNINSERHARNQLLHLNSNTLLKFLNNYLKKLQLSFEKA